jgi:hypothetical protein
MWPGDELPFFVRLTDLLGLSAEAMNNDIGETPKLEEKFWVRC